MNAPSYLVSDTFTMSQRVLTHMLRNPMATILSTLVTPVLLLVLMYNMVGGAVQQTGTLSAGTSYIDYLTPGLILITVMYGMSMTTVRVNMDMTQGIIARFRTMSIARVSVLNGHVLGSSLGMMFGVIVIVGLAFLTGFRPVTTDPLALLAAFGLVVLFIIAITWLGVAIGVASKSAEAAQSALFIPLILPFLSTALVPTSSMTPVLAVIAENQPFSPIIDTLRALLMDTPVGTRGLVALGWCVAMILVGYLWARFAYNRSSVA